MEEWCIGQLEELFESGENLEDILQYVLTFTDENDLVEYLGEIVQHKDSDRISHFSKEFLKRKETQKRVTVRYSLL